MTLRFRLGLAAVGLAVVLVVGFGATAYVFFSRQQSTQLRLLLEQDLERVTALLDQPVLGSSFARPSLSGVILEMVAPNGVVMLRWGEGGPLPNVTEPQRATFDSHTYLVMTGPWQATGGTVRLAHDIEASLAVRRGLLRVLLASAVVVTLVAALVALLLARRMLSPLASVARQARTVDPALPGSVDYAGPAHDEIGDLVTALNGSLGAIRQRQEAERGFLLDVAHELAAPLTLVNYHLQDLRRDHPDDPRMRAAAEGTMELLRTSQDLLVLARGELERPLEPKIVDLREIVGRVADEYPGVSMTTNGTLEVVGDPERLMQVVRNLVRNALTAVGGPDGVTVALSRDAEMAVLEVRDQGPGMSEETIRQIFDRGFSGAGGGGVGVGLSICRQLVEQHHGELLVESHLGEGSRFQVRLASLDSRLTD